MEKIRTLTLFSIITASLIVGQMGQTASAGPIFKQVTLEDLGILQLAAHDLFLVDRVLEIDFENGFLDLSTLFTDVKTGLEFSDAAIGMGGEQRNRENIMLFTVASELGQMYLDLKAIDGAESARQQTIVASENSNPVFTSVKSVLKSSNPFSKSISKTRSTKNKS